uniref:Uncharacterized protein n=1 Tax=Myoviridae sp. ctjhW4 TaxID=2825162 RepID=A0A8S5PT96_9CAUD|nr:MAG TPA: hypothetical protein [Myoviridae sp. ctjhW4]
MTFILQIQIRKKFPLLLIFQIFMEIFIVLPHGQISP